MLSQASRETISEEDFVGLHRETLNTMSAASLEFEVRQTQNRGGKRAVPS
jgi:hypothetical protein